MMIYSMSRTRAAGLFLSFGAMCATSNTADAQAGALTKVAKSSEALGTPQTPVLRRSPADTGRMAWGRKDFSRYESADACDRATEQVLAEFRRSRVFDTLPYRLEADTVFTVARDMARTCGSKYTVETIDPRELWSLFRLSQTLGNFDYTKAVIVRQLALSKTLKDSASVLVKGINSYLSGSPPRLDFAQALLKELDAMGPTQKVSQFEGRVALMGYWQTVYNVDSLRVYATAAVEQSRTMSLVEKDEVPIVAPYNALLTLANETQDVAGQEKIFNEALSDVGSWRDGKGAQWTTAMGGLIEMRKALYGKKTKPLAGTFWFNEKGSPRPLPGKMSLIVHVDHTCGEQCFSKYIVLRQLMAKYGDELDVTFVTETRGFAAGTGPLEPADEAKKAASYFLDFLKFPVAVLVDETPWEKIPDGRRFAQPSAIGSMFAGWRTLNTVLIDKEGRIQWLGTIGRVTDERMVTAAIDRLRTQ